MSGCVLRFIGVAVALGSLAAVPTLAATVSAGAAPAARVATWDESGRIFLWDVSGALQAGWPVAASGAWPIGTPRLQDLDGDGQPEVVCLMKSWNGGRTVRAWRLDGRPFPGYEALACPADMADTPQRGRVTGAGASDWAWPTSSGAVSVSPVGDPSHPRPGFPVPISAGRLRLRLADLDGDGVDEVLGGVDEGATGRWFVLRMRDGEPALLFQVTPTAVTAAPVPAQLTGDSAPELLIAMRGSLECRSADGAGGYAPMPGWPVAPAVGAAGDAAVLAQAAPCVVARGPTGSLAAYTAQGHLTAQWASGVRLGPAVDHADLPASARGTQWVAHDAGAALRFESDAGADSAGRPRLYTLELGNRHHAVYASAPVGLLPPLRCHLWINGRMLSAQGPPPVLSQSEIVLHGAKDQPAPAESPGMDLVLRHGTELVGRASGRDELDLRLTLNSGVYSALVMVARDTLARAEFRVDAPLALRDVFNYPNPMKDRTDFLFELNQGARVSLDIYTVAGRKVRSLGGDFLQGRQRLGWDGRDALGQASANGVYLFRIAASSGSERVETMGKLIRLN